MKVYIEREDRMLDISAGNVAELLKKLNVNPTTVLVIKNDQLVTEDEKLDEGDEIKILSVISGG